MWSVVERLGIKLACCWCLLLVAGSAWVSSMQVKSLPEMEKRVMPMWLVKVSCSPSCFQKESVMPRLQSLGSALETRTWFTICVRGACPFLCLARATLTSPGEKGVMGQSGLIVGSSVTGG